MCVKQRQSKTMTMNWASTTHCHLCEPPNIFDSVWHRCQNQNLSCTNCTLVKTFWLLYDDRWLDCSSISCLNYDLNLNAYILHIYIIILTYVLNHNKICFPSNIVCFPIYRWIFWVTALKITPRKSPGDLHPQSLFFHPQAEMGEGVRRIPSKNVLGFQWNHI